MSRRKNVLLICLLLILTGSALFYYFTHIYQNSDAIRLGQEFKLTKNEVATLPDEDLKIEIIGFVGHCPAGAMCLAGPMVNFAYTHEGEDITGMQFKALGYDISVIDSDYESYARLKVEETKK